MVDAALTPTARYVRELKKVPSVPTIVSKVNELLANPESSAQDFDRLVSSDPVLAAKLLKLVNSAFYGLTEYVDSIARAVAMVGFRQMTDLVTSIAVLHAFSDVNGKAFKTDQFWKHSLACALTARTLAVYRRSPAPDVYFTAGLLHDLGKLILMANSPQEYATVFERNRSGTPSYLAEKDVFGFHHGELGSELARIWRYPANLQECMHCHHTPDVSLSFSELTATVHVADVIVHSLSLGFSGEAYVPPLSVRAWDLTALRTSMLAHAVERTRTEVEDAWRALLS